MSQYLIDKYRNLKTGEHSDTATSFSVDLDIDIENTLGSLRQVIADRCLGRTDSRLPLTKTFRDHVFAQS